MIITKEQLNEKLKTKYSSKGLRKEALAKLTDTVYAQLTEESTDEDVETAIAGVEPYVSLMQSEIDYAKTPKPAEETSVSGEQTGGGASATTTKKEEGGEDTPAWAKELIESNESLASEVATLKGEKVTATRQAQLNKALEGLTDEQKRGYSRIKIDKFTDEEFATEMEGINTETEEIRTENAKRGVVTTPPIVGGNNPQVKEPPKEQKEAVENQLKW